MQLTTVCLYKTNKLLLFTSICGAYKNMTSLKMYKEEEDLIGQEEDLIGRRVRTVINPLSFTSHGYRTVLLTKYSCYDAHRSVSQKAEAIHTYKSVITLHDMIEYDTFKKISCKI